MGEIEAAANETLPELVFSEDIQGALHCHSTYSDGGATIAEMAEAARERGWKYIGISDHSEAAFYAGGMKRDDVKRQHEEIDELNSQTNGFRILKGIECDILPSGELDYGDATLDSFEYIIGSVHSQFRMDEKAMTARILSAMDDPRLTILGHATGRLLLSRDAYALDMDAVIEKAAETGAALELNCDPHRMDLDWRYMRQATRPRCDDRDRPGRTFGDRAEQCRVRSRDGSQSVAGRRSGSQRRERIGGASVCIKEEEGMAKVKLTKPVKRRKLRGAALKEHSLEILHA